MNESAISSSEFVAQMLQTLNCAYQTEDHDGFQLFTFEYQGGHFRISASKTNSSISIEYPLIFTAESQHLDVVRALCNEMNFQTRFSRFAYSVNGKECQVHVHLFTGFNVPPTMAQEDGSFKAILESHFGLQREFLSKVGVMIRKNERHLHTDLDLENLESSHLLYMLSEHEISHQRLKMRFHYTPLEPLQLGHILYDLLDDHSDFTELKIVGEEVDVLTNPDEIPTFPLLDPLVEVNDTGIRIVTDQCTYLLKGESETMVIQVTAKAVSDFTAYFRVNVMCPGRQTNSYFHHEKRSELPAYTFLVGYNISTEANHEAEYKYMWEEAQSKVDRGMRDSLTPEQACIAEMGDPDLARSMYWGRKYFGQKRYLDALHHLEHVHQVLNEDYHKLTPHDRELFFHVCSLIGFAYSELRQYTKALFYLEIVCQVHRYRDIAMYVNCLVNSGDFRAISVIRELLRRIRDIESLRDITLDEDTETPLEDKFHLIKLKNFLRRRRAYVLIELGQYEKAEKFLKNLLKEEDSADFASDEILYLQKLREEEK